MTVQRVIRSLEKLIQVKSQLLNISQSKTEIVTAGSVDNLQTLLVKERKYIRLLERAESDRATATMDWMMENESPQGNITISEILTMVNDEKAKQKLEQTAIQLTNIITQLKLQEQLNHALINQSMQFVHMSLDVMNPSINQVNYGNKREMQVVERSLFDSKA
jgi:flagellar biosynthesis/type III secretory pathway chaperone